MYIVCIREKYCFSLVCTFRKAIKICEVNIDSQKGFQDLEEKLTIDVLVSFTLHFHPLLLDGDSSNDLYTQKRPIYFMIYVYVNV